MARTGQWRLSIVGAMELQQRYQQGRWASVSAFCEAVGIPRTTYYELIRRDRWFERETLLTTLASIGIPSSDFPRLCEYRGQEPEALQPTSTLAHNKLPHAVTSFIGREQDIMQVRSLLKTATLLTLTGAGGTGKTRLALQVAAELEGSFPDGVWLVELASVPDPDLVPQAVATVFSIREQIGVPLVETLARSLSARSLLIVIDNCEHLLDATAALVSTLVRHCPNIRLCATSRQRLAVTGEQIYSVPSLALPDVSVPVAVADIADVESVRLFVERARLYRPTFKLNHQNAANVALLCRRLDGIPLALELAAARVRSISVEEILVRLDRVFDLLTGGDRTVLPRHQTLRALVDWSYELLLPQEKVLLQRLSVFPAGWTLAAAEVVCSSAPLDKSDILELLTSLVDKSIVLLDERDGTVRYRMYDTLRHYAAEKLELSGESNIVLTRRQNWLLQFALDAEQGIRVGVDHAKCMQRLEWEHDNLRAALVWDGADHSDAQAGMHLAATLWRFWMIHGYSREGYEHLRRALAREYAQERTVVRSSALTAAGNLANNLGDYGAAIDHYLQSISIRQEAAEKSQEWSDKAYVAGLLQGTAEVAATKGDISFARELFTQSQQVHLELLQLHRNAGDKLQIAEALSGPGRVAAELGDYLTARALLEEHLKLRRELGDSRRVGMALTDLSFVARKEGNYAEFRALFEESIGIKSELGDRRGVALGYYDLGEVAWLQSDYSAAHGYYEAALTLFGELGADRQYIAMCMEGVGTVLMQKGNVRQAVQLWSRAASLRASNGTPVELDKRATYEGNMSAARTALGDDEFEAAWSEGQ